MAAKRHRAGRSRKHLVGNARIVAGLTAIDRRLSGAQDELARLITAEDRAESPARTKHLDDLYSQIEKSRRALHDRTWRRG
jgi:hypothetical protein